VDNNDDYNEDEARDEHEGDNDSNSAQEDQNEEGESKQVDESKGNRDIYQQRGLTSMNCIMDSFETESENLDMVETPIFEVYDFDICDDSRNGPSEDESSELTSTLGTLRAHEEDMFSISEMDSESEEESKISWMRDKGSKFKPRYRTRGTEWRRVWESESNLNHEEDLSDWGSLRNAGVHEDNSENDSTIMTSEGSEMSSRKWKSRDGSMDSCSTSRRGQKFRSLSIQGRHERQIVSR